MLPIKDLLNPEPGRQFRVSGPVPIVKRKMAKDAPVFLPGKIQGECRYPPCEERDEELERAHREFQLRPMGNIAEFPRHIPYASDKKSFQQKTGRDSFDVFQYTFQIPGEEKEWHVMWDYNIGIVRITHLFKCNGYSKTTPGKMLAQNNGLRDICHSITGGALAAQGYWMPYDAAKALAATFCWRIRHVLTPLFGTDFPAMCIHPDDRKRHGVMVIDPDITRRATLKANYYRSLEMTSSPRSVPAPVTTYHLIRDMDALSNDESDLKLPPIKYPRHRYADSIASARDSSAEPYSLSPKSQSPSSSFTPINPPRSIIAPPRSHATSPKTILRGLSRVMRRENGADAISEDSDTDSDGSSNVYSTPDCPSLDINMGDKMLDGPSDVDTRPSDSDLTDTDEDWATDDATDKDYHRSPSTNNALGKVHKGNAVPASPSTRAKKNPDRKSRASRPPSSLHFAREVKAAEALIRLHMNELETSEAEADIDGNALPSNIASRSLDGVSCGGKRRRASL